MFSNYISWILPIARMISSDSDADDHDVIEAMKLLRASDVVRFGSTKGGNLLQIEIFCILK